MTSHRLPPRELAALVLLGYVGLVVLIQFCLLFAGAGDFSDRATIASSTFVSPVLVAFLVAAVALATYGERTPRARQVTQGALGVLATMAALALVSWLAGLSVGRFGFVRGLGGIPLAGKVAGTFASLLGIALIAAAGWYVYAVLRELPVPVRTPRAARVRRSTAPTQPTQPTQPVQPTPQPIPPPPPVLPPPPTPGPVDDDVDDEANDEDDDEDDDDRPIWRAPSS